MSRRARSKSRALAGSSSHAPAPTTLKDTARFISPPRSSSLASAFLGLLLSTETARGGTAHLLNRWAHFGAPAGAST